MIKRPFTLNTRLVLSHLAVSLISIILIATFAGKSIYQAAISESEHNLQALSFAAANALELPLQEYKQGKSSSEQMRKLLSVLFSDIPGITFTVFKPDGTPITDISEELPPRADFYNAPEVPEALRDEIGRGISIRNNKKGEETLYMAVLVQAGIEVIGILRVSVPLAPVKAKAQRSMLWLVLTAVFVAVAVSLFGWLLAKNLSQPIQVLTEAAEEMESGDMSVRVQPSGPRELQTLAIAFNKMANRLQSNVNELRGFVANASHELRTPLTVVKLRTEALLDGALDDHEVSLRFIKDIENEVDRLVRMVNDMLDLSRMEAGMDEIHPTLLNLSTIIKEVYETFKIRAERADIALKMTIEPGLPSVMGNEDQIRRVFYNLLDNAIKYTPKNGEVQLTLRSSPQENYVRVEVQDNGPGIKPEQLKHVFERFYRIDVPEGAANHVRGSGLGLAIAKTIVESHGGNIGVISHVGKGTTFWVDLPVSE